MDATEFGKKIMTLRKQKGLTQAKLAEQINVSNKTISRWETGEGFPEISLLKPLAKALGTTVDDLLSDEEEEKAEKPKHNFFDFLGKHSAYEEVPIEITFLKEYVIETLKSGKLFFLLYILFMTGFIFPAGSTYSDVINDVECQLAQNVVYKYLLVLGITAIGMMIVQIRQWRKKYLDVCSMIVNGIALVIFVTGYFISYRDRMHRGFWNCEYFSVDRLLMLKVTQIVLTLVIITYILVGIRKWKNKEFVKLKRFWESMVIFNKISFVCLGIYIFVLIIDLSSVFLGSVSYLTTASMVSAYLCRVGLFSSLLGLLISLLGGYKKQTNGYIFFAIMCFVGQYLFVWIAMMMRTVLIQSVYWRG